MAGTTNKLRMSFPLIVSSLIAAFFLTGCDSSPARKRGAHEFTAIVQILSSLTLPVSQNFLSNQIAVFKTASLIEAAALSSQISPKTLSASLEFTPSGDPGLLTITAYHGDETLPKVIIQSLLDAYLDHRKDLESQTLKTLDEAITKQSVIIENSRADLATFLKPYGFTSLDETTTLGENEPTMFRAARFKLNDFETRRDQLEIEIMAMKDLVGEELIQYTDGLGLPSNSSPHYARHREAIESKHTLLAQGLAPNHPDILTLKKRADKAMEDAENETVTLKKDFTTELEFINRQIDLIVAMVENRQNDRHDVIKNSSQTIYTTAKQAYHRAQEDLHLLKIRQQRSQALLTRPPRFFMIRRWNGEETKHAKQPPRSSTLIARMNDLTLATSGYEKGHFLEPLLKTSGLARKKAATETRRI
ncbi:MAG: hypothetical protein ACJAQT_001467 [Akkermansiaceae bacterium]|jgi:hypothetical protein